MKFKNIHFIVNPISGKGTGKKAMEKIHELFFHHNITVKVTTGKNDAFKFATASIEEGADLIVSCGGDGTINEVASALVYSDVPLGIVPIGSGNGLARHLQIPLKYTESLQMILNDKNEILTIDCGKINTTYFFSNAGIGFDAEAVKIYSSQKQRQLLGYAKSVVLSVLKFKPIEIIVKSENLNFNGEIMMLNISNSNCMGYGFSVAPKASLTDGIFDVNLVPKTSWLFFGCIGLGFLFNKKLTKKQKLFNTKELQIEIFNTGFMQLDGEYHPLDTKKVSISMCPKALKVLVS